MQHQNAYSLIELLVVLSLLAILTLLAFPSLTSFSVKQEADLLRDHLLTVIHLARQEADSYGVPISLCHSKTGRTCEGEWREGQLLFVDEDETGNPKKRQAILFTWHNKTVQGQLKWRSFPERSYLSFFPNESNTANNGSFWYCPRSHQGPAWAILINKAQRERIVYPDKKGHIKDSHGLFLAC